MRQSKWGRAIRRMERKQAQESRKDLKSLDGVRRRSLKRGIIFSFLILLLGGAAVFYFVFDVGSWQRLDIVKIVNLPQTGAIYDRNGDFVAKIQSTQNRVSIPLSSVPKEVQNAFLAAEDLRFYQHFGIDPVRIFGALRANFRSGDYAEGASTITQQLVKLSHLSSQKTIGRKLEEMYLALQLESQYSKDEILEMYLNFIYFGRGAYGIEAAAQAYFGVPARELSAAQGAVLAAVIKAPSAYAPHLHPEQNRQRQEYILRTMRENGMLSEESYQAALAQDVTPIAQSAQASQYGWYVDAVLDEAEALLSMQAETLLGGGYHVYTSFDREQQDIIDGHFEPDANFPGNASDGTRPQAAMASVDVHSGAVRYCVGESQSIWIGASKSGKSASWWQRVP